MPQFPHWQNKDDIVMHHLLVSKGPHVRWWSCEMIRELKTSCLLGRITAVLTAELKTSCLLVASQRIVHVFVAVQEHSTRSRAQCVAPDDDSRRPRRWFVHFLHYASCRYLRVHFFHFPEAVCHVILEAASYTLCLRVFPLHHVLWRLTNLVVFWAAMHGPGR